MVTGKHTLVCQKSLWMLTIQEGREPHFPLQGKQKLSKTFKRSTFYCLKTGELQLHVKSSWVKQLNFRQSPINEVSVFIKLKLPLQTGTAYIHHYLPRLKTVATQLWYRESGSTCLWYFNEWHVLYCDIYPLLTCVFCSKGVQWKAMDKNQWQTRLPTETLLEDGVYGNFCPSHLRFLDGSMG